CLRLARHWRSRYFSLRPYGGDELSAVVEASSKVVDRQSDGGEELMEVGITSPRTYRRGRSIRVVEPTDQLPQAHFLPIGDCTFATIRHGTNDAGRLP